jgi:pyruvate dehydrogenase E2 component (dihydrolipoamide acetyltransferase)
MQKTVVMPLLGPSIEEGLLISWHVAEGEFVKRGATLFSVETDKSIVDCEATDEGYLSKILVPAGSNARVAQSLAELTDMPVAVANRAGAHAALAKSEPATAVNVVNLAAASGSSDQRMRISPRARRVARESGVPIEQVQGTGPDGRIVERDIASYRSAAVWAHAGRANVRAGVTGSTREIALTPMRKAIARRLTEAAQSIPSFFTTVRISADAMLSLRAQINGMPDTAVSINDIVVRATALALRICPEVNATFYGEVIRLHEDIDLCVAIALDDGLIAPIVRNADAKSLMDIAAEIRGLAAEARAGKLQPADYQGGTFTISNLGMHGVESFTAIINPPQCAILAVGGIDRELYLDGGAPRERNVMKVTLTADHRAIDGALAAKFLGELKTLIEHPARLLV